MGVLLFLALWLALAISVGWLVFRITRQPFWAIIAAAVVLADRSLFLVAQTARPELVASLVLFVVWLALAGIPPFRGRRGHAALVGGLFLMPLVHPVTLGAGAVICLVRVLRARAEPAAERKSLVTSLGGFAGGCVALFLWFYLQPDAWAQFLDHASTLNKPYWTGVTCWRALQYFYYPTFTGHILWGVAVGYSAVILGRSFLGGGKAEALYFWGAVLLGAGLGIDQKFGNECYLGICLPEAVAMVVLLLHRQWGGPPPVPGARWARGGVVLFLACHSLFWATRTQKFVGSGRPRIRAELDGYAARLPGTGKILIPDVLWEAELPHRDHCLLNTLPQMASGEWRRSYEAYAYAQLSRGDVVIVDLFQVNRPLQVFSPREWTKESECKRVFPGREAWGYDLVLWKKN